MKCQICQKQQASVHVTDVHSEHGDDGSVESSVEREQHVCGLCARNLFRVSVANATPKVEVNIWKLLQVAKQKTTPTCPDCGMTLSEFRSKGRLGCPKDYEHFWPHIAPLLDRVHNATHHVQGGEEEEEGHDPQRQLLALRDRLRTAISKEAYEQAAALRDEIEALENDSGPVAPEGAGPGTA